MWITHVERYRARLRLRYPEWVQCRIRLGWLRALFILHSMPTTTAHAMHLNIFGALYIHNHDAKFPSLSWFKPGPQTQQTWVTEPLLIQCWFTVYDAGSTINQQWVNKSFLSALCMTKDRHYTRETASQSSKYHNIFVLCVCIRNKRLRWKSVKRCKQQDANSQNRVVTNIVI